MNLDKRHAAVAAMAMSIALSVMAIILALTLSFPAGRVVAAGSPLSVEIIAGYNLVVDSNVMAISTYAPSVATVAGKICNTSGTQTLTGVQGYVGDYKGGVGSTPGVYPSRDSSQASFIARHPHLANTGLYSYSHVGGRLGSADASRYIGSLAPGECRVQYWHFTYPRRGNPNNTGQAVWGATNNPDDDLWLEFDVWATSGQGDKTSVRQRMTMRNEISAMANKIRPNPDGHWFNTDGNTVRPGSIITSNGILYELGVINQGFDNDGDYTPDFNAWLQPIGDPSYDPSCFRLIRTSGVLTVSRSAGNPDLIIPFNDKLYFTHLPPDNNGVRGLVYYTFMTLNGPCSTSLTPYQEVASGSDNEKFNGDYGTGIPPVGSSQPQVTIDKTGSVTTTAGSRITYTVGFGNSGTSSAGLPLQNAGVVISDSIPVSTTYVAGSARAAVSYLGNGVTILYSADYGVTWTPTEPVPAASVTTIQWWLNDPLPAGSSGMITYSANVAPTYSPPITNPFVENCAGASFGVAPSFAQDCASTLINGTNRLGDRVWRDENGNGIQDAGEVGIANILITLYVDRNVNGVLDSSDTQIMTTTTDASGIYTFSNLPNGNFIAKVDTLDSDLPFGYGVTTASYYAVTPLNGTNSPYFTMDFGFGPVLRMTKDLISSSPAYEGDTITYTIRLTNTRPGNGTGQSIACTYLVWAATEASQSAGAANGWTNPGNALGARGPDGSYATSNYANTADILAGTNYTLGVSLGKIARVEALYSLYFGGSPLVDDYMLGKLYFNNDTTPITTINFTQTLLNTFGGGAANQGLLTWDVTSARLWTWADFTGNLDLELDAQKVAGKDNAIANLDAIGFRVTSDQTCGGSNETIATLPLTDTYNASQLRFLSATPTNNSTYTQTTPYANTGVISWTNLGPVYGGQTKFVTVTFKALEPAGNVTATLLNTATVRNAAFGDGRRVNDATDDAITNLNPTASLGDFVWRDLDSDGVQDAGEVGVPNVVISLTANVTLTINGVSYAPLSTVTTTDANGNYLFEGLRYTGRYTVTVYTGTLPGGSFTQTGDPDVPGANCSASCDNRYSLNITPALGSPNDTIRSADFGYNLPSLIEGYIWHDWNRNGASTPDAGEDMLSGVVVTLSTGVTTTTNANGYYKFTGSFAGTYTVTVSTGTLPAGTWTPSFDTNGLATPNQSSVVVVTGGVGRADFSYYKTGPLAIGDTVYVDWNGDGVQASAEEGLPNITISLYEDSNGNSIFEPGVDALMITTTTSLTGYYTFNSLPAGSYYVIVDRTDPDFPTNYQQTQDPDEASVCITCNDRGRVTLAASDAMTIDFGYKPGGYGSIGDFVWRDLDHDGLQDLGESGIANITVRLYHDLNGDGVYNASTDALVMTTITNAGGTYTFNNLIASNYLVEADTTDPDLPLDGNGRPYIPSTSYQLAVALSSGQNDTDADLGFTPGGQIGDTIYRDDNSSGLQDLSEPGIANAQVNLYNDVDGNGRYDALTDTLYATTTANPTGIYLFRSLPAGNYVIVVVTSTLPAGFTQTGDPDLTTICSGSACDSQSGLSLSAGQIDLSRDFGYKPLGVMGDFVWRDLNGNGVQDAGEPGIGGVVITLTLQGGGTLTTTTDSDGYYAFGNVPDGAHTVSINTGTLPANLTQTYDPDQPGGPCSVCNNQGSATISGGNADLTMDFGYRLTGSYNVSGHVFFDSGNNGGLYTPPGDLPYSGITLYLYDSRNKLIGTTTTDAAGAYSFTNLPGGSITYTVAYDPNSPKLTGMSLSADPDVSGVCGACNNFTSFPITTANVADKDFGLYNTMDFGDLPDSYGTTLAVEGARHLIDGVYLGSGAPDGDGDGRASANATGDNNSGANDETGVSRDQASRWLPGNTVNLNVVVTGNTGYLVAWFDWNDDGDFDDADETVTIGNLISGTNNVALTVSSAYTTSHVLNARFRLYDSKPSLASPKGLAVGGEVEDYQWIFSPTAVTLRSFEARSVEASSIGWSTLIVSVLLGAIVVFRRRQRKK